MKRITFNLDSRNYYVTKYICLGEYLFLLLLDENKEVFSDNVICVNQKFELLHRFERPNSIILRMASPIISKSLSMARW